MLQDWRCPFEEIPIGKGRKLHDGDDIAILSIGPMGNNVTEAMARLAQEASAPSIAHYDMRFLKPIDEDILEEVGQKFSRIITVENGAKKGGLGSAVLEWMNDHNYQPKVVRLGLPDSFVEHGTVAELQHIVGIDADGIINAINTL